MAASRSETSARKTFPVPVFSERLSLPLAQATRFQTGPTNRTTGAPSSPSYIKLSPPSKGSSLGQTHTRCSQIAVKAKALSAQSTEVDVWPDAHNSRYSTSTVLSEPIYLSPSATHRCSIVGQMHTGPIPGFGLTHWSLFQPSIPLVTSVGASLAATPSISQTLLSILPVRKSSCDYFEPKLGDVVRRSRRRKTVKPITFLEIVCRLLRPQR